MTKPLGITIQGFSTFERATFDSFFRLSMRRNPAYRMTPALADCDYVIADADNAAATDAVVGAGRLGTALMIGARQEIQPLYPSETVIQSLALMKGDTFILFTLDDQGRCSNVFRRLIGNLFEAVFVKAISQPDSI